VAAVVEATEDAARHRRWDLRFGLLDPRPGPDARPPPFNAVATDGGVRLVTRYDYRLPMGRLGGWIDRVAVRPVLAQATAWSSDRLRIWLEDGIPPEQSRNTAVAHGVAASTVAGIWMYHGLVPKLWKVDADELTFFTVIGLGTRAARAAVRAAGVAETAFGVATARSSNRRWPFALTLMSMPVFAVGAVVTDRRLATRAFNPVSLNAAITALAGVALATHSGRPSGRTRSHSASSR